MSGNTSSNTVTYDPSTASPDPDAFVSTFTPQSGGLGSYNATAPTGNPGNVPTAAGAPNAPAASTDPLAQYEPYIAEASRETGAPTNMIRAMIQTESHGDPTIVSPQGAVGLMQLEPSTGAALGAKDLTDPGQNILAGARYLMQGLKASGGDWNQALQYYHGGPDKSIWGPLTQAYPGQVLSRMDYKTSGGTVAPAPNEAPAQASVDPDTFTDQWIKKAQPPAEASPAPAAASPVAALPAAASPVAQPLTPAQQAQLQALKAGAPGQPTAPQPGAPPVVQPNVNPGWNLAKEWANAISLGAAKPIAAGIGAGIGYLSGQPLGATYTADMNAQNAAQNAYQQQHPGMTAAAQTIGPIPAEVATGAGAAGLARGIGEVVGEALPAVGQGIRYLAGAPGAGAGIVSRIGSGITGGALEGAASSAAGSGVTPQNGGAANQGAVGAVAGGVLGGTGAAVGRALVPGVRAGVQGSIDALRSIGVDLPTGTIAGNGMIRAAAGHDPQHILPQVTAAANREIGLTSTHMTSQDVDLQKQALGHGIESAAGQISIQTASNPVIGAQVKGELGNLYTQYAQQAATEPAANNTKIQGTMDLVRNLLTGNQDIPGPTVQNLIKKGGSVSLMQQSADPTVKFYGNELRGILEDGMDATAAANPNNPAFNAYRTLRQQYRTATQLEPIADKSGDGLLNPAAIGRKFANAPVGSPLKIIADAANSGQLPTKAVPSNAGRAMRYGADLAGAVAGGVLGHSVPGLEAAGAIAGGGAAELAQHLGPRVLNSNAYRNMITSGGRSVPLQRAAPVVAQTATNPPNGVNLDFSTTYQAPANNYTGQ